MNIEHISAIPENSIPTNATSSSNLLNPLQTQTSSTINNRNQTSNIRKASSLHPNPALQKSKQEIYPITKKLRLNNGSIQASETSNQDEALSQENTSLTFEGDVSSPSHLIKVAEIEEQNNGDGTVYQYPSQLTGFRALELPRFDIVGDSSGRIELSQILENNNLKNSLMGDQVVGYKEGQMGGNEARGMCSAINIFSDDVFGREAPAGQEFETEERRQNENEENKIKNKGRKQKSKAAKKLESEAKKERTINIWRARKELQEQLRVEAEKPYSIDIHLSESTPEQNIKKLVVGANHQVELLPFRLNKKQEPQRRKIKTVWRPDFLKEGVACEEYVNRMSKVLKRNLNEEKAVKLLMKFGLDIDALIREMEKNRMFYLDYFKTDNRRSLRSENLSM